MLLFPLSILITIGKTGMNFEILGNTEHVKKAGNILIIQSKEATARIWIYSDSIIRINVSKAFDDTDRSFAVIQQPARDFEFTESDEEITIATKAIQLQISKNPLRFRFYNAEGKPLGGDDDR